MLEHLKDLWYVRRSFKAVEDDMSRMRQELLNHSDKVEAGLRKEIGEGDHYTLVNLSTRLNEEVERLNTRINEMAMSDQLVRSGTEDPRDGEGLRHACLQLAVQQAPPSTAYADVVAAAKMFHDYVKGVKPEETKA